LLLAAGDGINRPSWIPARKMIKAVRNPKLKLAILMLWDVALIADLFQCQSEWGFIGPEYNKA